MTYSTPLRSMTGRPSPLNSRSPKALETARMSHTRPSSIQPPASCTRWLSDETVSPDPYSLQGQHINITKRRFTSFRQPTRLIRRPMQVSLRCPRGPCFPKINALFTAKKMLLKPHYSATQCCSTQNATMRIFTNRYL